MLEASGPCCIDIINLGQLRQLTSLRLCNIQVGAGEECLAALDKLVSLDLNNTDIEVLSVIASCSELTYLDAPMHLRDHQPIFACTKLVELIVPGNELLYGISQLSNLQKLQLQHNMPAQTDNSLYQLSCILSLRTFIVYSKRINQLEFLQPLTLLEELSVEIDQPIQGPHDLAPLSTLTGLTSLRLLSIPASSIQSISLCSNLKVLSLSNCGQLTNISVVFSHLVRLTSLSLEDLQQVTSILAVHNLWKLPLLEQLRLHDLNVCDLSALSALTSLTDMELHNLNADDFSVLSSLVKLQHLSIKVKNNEARNMQSITACTDLRSLHCELRQNVESFSFLSQLSKLSDSNVSDKISAIPDWDEYPDYGGMD